MRSKIFYGIVSLFLLFSFFSCDLFSEGYGDKADLRDPELSIDGNNGGFIKGEFTLTGTATDDIKVKDVIVTITNYGNNKTETRSAAVKGTKWSLKFDTISDPLFSDGELEFIVKVTDTSKKSLSKKRLLFVDNLKPTVLINTPDKYGAGESYNQKVIVKGETKDYKVKENIVSLIHIATGEKFSVEADRTPSWSATFNTGAFVSENGQTIVLPQGQYYLMVESTDMAGNTNDYFYHTSDTQNAIEINKKATVEELANPANQEIQRVKDIRKDATKKVQFYIDPDSDLPQIEVKNWQVTGGNFVQKNFKDSVDVVVNFSDDDGLDEIFIALFDKGVDYSDNSNALRYETFKVSSATKVFTQEQFSANLMSLDWGIFGIIPPDDALKTELEKEGQFIIKLWATDTNVGDDKKKSEPLLIPYRIDGGPPTLNIGSRVLDGIEYSIFYDLITPVPVKDSFAKENFKISGTAHDGSGVAVIIEVKDVTNGRTNYYLAGSVDSSVKELNPWAFDSSNAKEVTMDVDIEGKYTGTYSNEQPPVSLLDIGDRNTVISVIATDYGPIMRKETLGPLNIDTKGPDVTIEIPQGSAVLNGKSEVVIRYNDDATVDTDSVKVIAKYYENTGDTTQVGSDIEITRDTDRVYNIASSWYGDFITTQENSKPKYDKVEIIASVSDKAGNITNKTTTVKVDQSTDKPVVTFNLDKNRDTPESVVDDVDGHNLIQNSGLISGTITDDDGITEKTMKIAFFDSSKAIIGGWETVQNKQANRDEIVTWSHPISNAITSDGVYGVAVEITDVNFNTTTPVNTPNNIYKTDTTEKVEFFFGYDTSTPEVILDPINEYMPNSFTLSGNIKDDSGIYRIDVAIKKKDAPTNEELFSYIYPIPNPDTNKIDYNRVTGVWSSRERFNLVEDGEYEVDITAYDKYGKYRITNKGFKVDNNPPTVTPTIPVSEVIGSALPVVAGTINLKGTSSDPGMSSNSSSVSVVEYSSDYPGSPHDPALYNWKAVNGTSNWNVYLDTAELGEGSKTLYFRAEDNAGNKLAPADYVSYSLIVDYNAPLIEEHNLGTTYTQLINSSRVISGFIDETNVEGSNPTLKGVINNDSVNPVTIPVNETLDVLVDTVNNKLLLTGYGFKVGDLISIASTTPPKNGSGNNINNGNYYIIDINSDGFKISSTSAGPPISFTTPGSGVKVSMSNRFFWEYLVDTSTPLFSDEITYNIKLETSDGVGRKSTIARSIKHDKTPPNLNLSNTDIEYINQTISLDGEVRDSNMIDRVTAVVVNRLDSTANYELTSPEFTHSNWYLTNEDITALETENSPYLNNIISTQTFLDTVNNYEDLVDKGVGYYKVNSGLYTYDAVKGDHVPVDNLDLYRGELVETIANPTDFTQIVEGFYKATSVPMYFYFNGAEFVVSTGLWEFDVIIEATDFAGNSRSVTKNLVIDNARDVPVLSLDNLTLDTLADSYIFPGQKIRGTITDDDLVDSGSLRVAVTTPGGPIVWNPPTTISSNSKSVSWGYTIPDSIIAGNKELYVKVSDNNTPAITKTRVQSFVIDKLPPDIATDLKVVDKDNTANSFLNKKSLTAELSVTVTDDTALTTTNPVVVGFEGMTGNMTNDTPVVSGGLFTFNIPTADIKEGITVFTVTATDQFGKVSVKTISLLKDKSEPTVRFSEPTKYTDINGFIDISGTASDPNLNSVKVYLEDKASIELTTGAVLLKEILPTDLSNWSFIFDSSLYDVPDEKSIVVKAQDSVGNVSIYNDSKINLSFDQSKDKPVLENISIKEYSTPSVVNTYHIEHDEDRDVLFGIVYSQAGDLKVITPETLHEQPVPPPVTPIETVSDIIQVKVDSIYKTPVVLTSTPSYLIWSLDLAYLDDPANDLDQTKDIVATVEYKASTGTVTDSYVGLEGHLPVAGQSVNLKSGLDTLSGIVKDDDLVDLSNMVIKLNGIIQAHGLSSVSKNESWSYSLTGIPSGLYLVEVSAKDSKKSIDYGVSESSDLYKSMVLIDNEAPKITATLKREDGTVITEQGAFVNGLATTSGKVADDIGIKDLNIVVDDSDTAIINVEAAASWADGDFVSFDNTKKEIQWDFKLGKLPDLYEKKSTKISYVAKDLAGKKSRYDQLITYDNTDPVVDIIYPVKDSTVTGTITVKGTVTDDSIDRLEIMRGDSTVFVPLDGTYNWEFELNTLLDTVPTDPDFDYPIVVKAYDKAGNFATNNDGLDESGNPKTPYKFTISPNLDKPIVNFISPSNNALLGGAVLVTGEAKDNMVVDSVWARIDVDGDGSFNKEFDFNGVNGTNDIFEREGTWYRINHFSGSTWKVTLNEVGELYRSNPIFSGIPSIKDYFTVEVKAFDNNLKESDIKRININIDDSAPKISSFGVKGGSSYVSGDLTLEGTFEDNEEVTILFISFDGGVTSEQITTFTELNPSSPTEPARYQFEITKTPAELDVVDDSKIFNIRLKATDSTSYSTYESIEVSVDNVAPTGLYSGNVNDIGVKTADGLSEKMVTISGVFNDPGTVSSFDRVEVYLVQNGKVIEPKTGIDVPTSLIDFNDGLGSVPYPTTVTKNNTITINDDREQGVIDTDEDGFIESIKYDLGDVIWATKFDSVNISLDTHPIDLHYVVYDKAGNKKHYTEVMLKVGFSFDKVSNVTEEEKIVYPLGFQALPGRLYIGAFGGSKANTHIEIYEGTSTTPTITTAAPVTEHQFNTTGFTGDKTYKVKGYLSGVPLFEKTIFVTFKEDSHPPTITVDDISFDSVLDPLGNKKGHYDYDNVNSKHKVSGRATIKGSAKDDTRIKDIKVTINGVTKNIAIWEGGVLTPAEGVQLTSKLHWKDGHNIEFEFDWDTSSIAGKVGNNISTQFRVNDYFTNSAASIARSYDVVPYITEVVRDSNFSTIRSKLGFYSLRNDESNITIKGYNFKTSGANDKVKIGATQFSGSLSGDDIIINLTGSGVTKSGYLSVIVNNIESTNNSNSNAVLSNRESLANMDETILWTDDRYIHLWESQKDLKTTNSGYFNGSNNPVHPAMTINSSGTLFASWSNYADADTYINKNTNGTRVSVFGTYDPPEHTDISIGTYVNVFLSANYYNGSTSEPDWGQNRIYYLSEGLTNYWNYKMESLSNDKRLLQFINQRVKSVGQAQHMSYYDTKDMSLKYDYRAYSTGPGTGNHWVNIDGGSDTHDGTRLVTGSRSTKAGEYSAIDILPTTNYPVIAYYDVANQKLKLAWSNSAKPTKDNWKRQDITVDNSYTGKYVSMRIDSEGTIHIAYYKTSTGDLYYIKSNGRDVATLNFTFDEPILVDSLGSVGAWADITLDGTTPSISYLDSSRVNTFDGLKMAHLHDIDKDPAAEELIWETQNAPLAFQVENVRTSIEADTGTNFWDNAIGYSSGDLYRVAYYSKE